VQVWWIPLDGTTPPAREIADLLDADERARAHRFVYPHHRARYVQAHAALRRILAACCGSGADGIALQRDANGRPELGPPHDHITFNLSHADDWAVVAVMDARQGWVGVDVEALAGADARAAELASTVLDTDELRQFGALPAAARGAAFITAWTRKEAALKATGWGLRIPPDTLHTGILPDAADATLPGPLAVCPPVRVQPLAAPRGHVASIAIFPPSTSASAAAQPRTLPHA
jgi:4'-phosphopantetheinyl transferase